ncbi:hypothetical protein BV898_00734 [Hypsibius exemplaris]|uniref:Uncharacterized protein n=1 Tax=Hypsibius exemplaris TaxID=2072580 RepID=A0A1W0XEB4_HYPEX|nr:hypothetical protein BV898_00734 [Hypsibius exemplaris]
MMAADRRSTSRVSPSAPSSIVAKVCGVTTSDHTITEDNSHTSPMPQRKLTNCCCFNLGSITSGRCRNREGRPSLWKEFKSAPPGLLEPSPVLPPFATLFEAHKIVYATD